jgi:hypothetical protein
MIPMLNTKLDEQLQFLSVQVLAFFYVSLASRIVVDYKLKRTFSYHIAIGFGKYGLFHE